MEEHQELLSRTFTMLTIPVVLFTPEGTLITANKAFERLVVKDGESVLNQYTHINQLFPRISMDLGFQKRVSTVLRVDSSDKESEVILDVIAIADDCRAIVVISSESEMEQFHNQRLRTLGTLAGGIAHDFNNVLAGILGHVSYLQTILPAKGPHRESLKAIADGGKKASVLTRQISSFSRLEIQEQAAPVNLGDLVEGMCVLLRGAFSPDCELVSSLPDHGEPVLVKGVEGKLGQIIANLVMNARDALESEGKIQVSVEQNVTPPGLEDMSPRRTWCVMRVIDNGSGIPDDVLERVFEPYFTTKQDTGTGLGLATVNALVRQMGGLVFIDTAAGSGTTVSCFFPCARSGEASEAEPDHAPVHALNNEYLLVVDDDDPVRNILGTSLSYLGYRVDRVSSGVEALRLLKAHQDRYDLVILDMLMPEMGGEEVYNELSALLPSLPVLVMSGHSSEHAVQPILENTANRFIKKPFTIEDLSKVVRECLQASPAHT